MKFPLSKLNVKEYQDIIYKLIKDDECQIFIDTNIIALFYGIHDSARKEFFDWLLKLVQKNRVKVPVWVVNEYTNRFIRDQIQDYLSPLKKVSTLKKEFQQVSAFLKMHIEDASLSQSSYGNVGDFQSDIKIIEDKLEKIAFAAKNKDEKYKLKIHNEINQLFDNCILNSNIDEILTSTDALGSIRYDHKLPPGFEDGKKELNAHGDLILWYEILDHCKKNNVKKVILITDDEKKDWVYAPNKLIINSSERSNNHPKFKIADPRLIHEFKIATESEDFFIISFELLTKILIENISNSFINLAGALQLVHSQTSENELSNIDNENNEEEIENDQITNLARQENKPTEEKITVDISEGAQEKQNKISNTYSTYALADRDFPVVDKTFLTKSIEQLKIYNWYVQNPAIEAILSFDSTSLKQTQFNSDSLFVLGRNIYQAACGGSGSAIEFVTHLRTMFTKYNDYFINHLYAGMVYEIYFNSSNEFRRENLKSYYLNDVFEALDLERLIPSKEFIAAALKDYEDNLLFLPYKNEDVKLLVDFNEELIIIEDWLGIEHTYLEVNQITANGIELLTEIKENSLDIYYPEFTYSGMIDFVCTTYGIPSKHYSVETTRDVNKESQISFGDKKLATTSSKKIQPPLRGRQRFLASAVMYYDVDSKSPDL